ncbi:hypothetical protein SAMN04488540_101275 [Ferrimonas sediminum]|uniref:Uncharacterized protein n=1 Tax=Ferrimonas sediminum TaxID=718193 RepID=A0A1G8K742_9GAMM|nr:hypothetical protein [Ferrimonas sediminum]SDI39223.1 hypothetical protein SAMN04488540_101275 [Ferrimonas sediminum]
MAKGVVFWLLLLSTASVHARNVEHLSINQVHSRPGEPLELTINVVGDAFVVEQLRFFLVQDGHRTLLHRSSVNNYKLHLEGSEPVNGNRAEVLVSSLFHDSADTQIHFSVTLDGDKAHSPQVMTSVQPVAAATVTAAAPRTRSATLKACPLNGNSFWSMSRELAPQLGLGHYGAMMALLQVNPDCFTNGDPQKLHCEALACPPALVLNQWQNEARAKLAFYRAPEVKPRPAIVMDKRSLWSVARDTATKMGLGRYGALMALVQANPGCFRSGNPNYLICEQLSWPEAKIIGHWNSEVSAKKRFESLSKAGVR